MTKPVLQDGYYWAKILHTREIEIVEIMNADSVCVSILRFGYDDGFRLDEIEIIESVRSCSKVEP